MKKLFLALVAAILFAGPLAAQTIPNTANLTASDAGTCATAGACLVVNVNNQNAASVVQLTGTWSATVQFEATTSQGGTFVAINAFPLNSTTAVTSATGNGAWRVTTSGLAQLRVRVSAFTSGTVAAAITASTGAAANAFGGGGGSGGTVTLVTFTGDGVVDSSTPSSAVTTSGTVAATLNTQAANSVFGNFTGSPAAPGFSVSPIFSAAGLTNFPTFNQNTTGSAANVPWSGNTNPTGNLSLAMASNSSTFNTTSAVSQFFAWKNTTAAVIGTSQSSPVGAWCGTEFHAAASVEGCFTVQFQPGNGTDAASTINFGHTGSATGVVTSAFPGPIQAGASSNAGAIFLPGNTSNPAVPSNSFGIIGPPSASFTSYALSIPSTPPSGTQYLGCGTPSSNVSACTWATVGGTPAGSNTQVQFNSSSAFGASANLTWVSPTLTIGVAGTQTGSLALASSTATGSVTLTPASAASAFTVTIPAATDTLVNLAGTQTLTNKSLVLTEINSGLTSGGVVCATSTTAISMTAALTVNVMPKGGGAGACPTNSSVTDNGTIITSPEPIELGSSPPTNTAGTSGGLICGEGTAFTGVSATDGFYCDSTLHALDIINQTTNIGAAVAEASIIGANLLGKAAGTNPQIAASSITDDGKNVTSAEVFVPGNKVFVTSDFTDSTSTTLTIITGLSWTLPTSKAVNVSFHCGIIFDQATAVVSDSFGIGITGTAPTQANASGTAFITASTMTTGTLTALASTTPTAVVTFTPGVATTLYKAELDGTIEQPSNATPGVFSIYAATTTGTDNFIVKRGSYCTLF